MRNALKLALVSLALLGPGLAGVVQARNVEAQMSGSPAAGGTYDYTLQLHNDATSTTSIRQFWFAWLPGYYDYDLMTSYPSLSGMPAGWYGGQTSSVYGGWGIDYYNSTGANLAPGQTDTFTFNSADSPTRMGQTSPYYPVPTTTSYIFDNLGGESAITVTIVPAPEPSSIALFGLGVVVLGWVGKRQMGPVKRFAAATFVR
jgi:hypothetical protein